VIGFTKLLCGHATVSRAVRQAQGEEARQPGLLQFTTADRPLVVWNMTTACNLKCAHCYNASGEAADQILTTGEARALIGDLAGMKVPVLLFSGGEPLLREDLYELGAYAAERGIHPVLSTNGTLITAEVASRLKQAGFQYVGVSIDGDREVHDTFRRRAGAFEAAWQGLHHARAAGIRGGLRFTVTRLNVGELPAVLAMAAEEGVERFCMYHLVYAGRAASIADTDLDPGERRELIGWLARRTRELHSQGANMEVLTTDNHADGIYLYRLLRAEDPARGAEVLELLSMHGGCSAGRKFANVDARGEVHACQFWGHVSLGSVRERPFSQIWQRPQHDLACYLKEMPLHLTGRCGECSYKAYCGGCRVRAEGICGDAWAADPACYLTDEEIERDGTH
jgi:radical SAM protein with 4Fe4S-binding SPASM domain